MKRFLNKCNIIIAEVTDLVFSDNFSFWSVFGSTLGFTFITVFISQPFFVFAVMTSIKFYNQFDPDSGFLFCSFYVIL